MFQYEEHYRILAVRKLEQEQNTWGGICSPNRALLNVALARERLLRTNNFRRCLSFELDCSTFFQPSGYFADLIPQLSEKRVMFQMAKILTNLKSLIKPDPLAGFVQPLSFTCPLTFLAVGSLFTMAPFCCFS